ncbi:nitrogen fixation protein [Methylomonas sp. MED-D]|uniref:nitrogen fixation protein n=1 Tax=unclassified Methylomonas TaxID=2608980 RepID=UPI0028A56B97|nr:nitrogen fixation protein [Methylomonas sp. MV1]MDT4329038.1 nitrogen fixation protein [Methylomonas sp. MV1]
MASETLVLCPSAQPDWEGSQVIGVMTGSAEQPELAYLKEALPVTDEILEMAGPVTPGEVFRFSAPCACSGCGHYRSEQSKCGLVEKVVRWTPTVVEQLPTCSIRSSCRWWLQEGRDACLHCPQVVTNDLNPSEDMRRASDLDVV